MHPRYASKPDRDVSRQFRDPGSKAKLRGVPISVEELLADSSGEEIGG
jgi:hypothetical protein